MAYQKTPSYLYRKAPGSPYYLKLPIPPALRHHFPDAKGKPRTHVVEALGTAKEAEAEQLKRPRLGHYWAAFKRLEAGQPLAPPSPARTTPGLCFVSCTAWACLPACVLMKS